jgi:diguanylate cyclase (GGDEF)-like protein
MIDPSRIWKSSQLPTVPAVAVRLLELTRDPECELSDVVAVIKTDPAISAKLLKAVNSGMFAFSTKITSIDRAVCLLGTTGVTSLALGFSLVEASMSTGALADGYSGFWLQSVVQAAAAETLGGQQNDPLGCDAILIGLLQDIARLAMLKTIPAEYREVLQTADTEPRELCEVETSLLGINHVEAGCQLLNNWKLPPALLPCIQHHHDTAEQIAALPDTPERRPIVMAAVAAAAGEYFCTPHKGRALERLRSLLQHFFAYSEPEIEQFIARTRERVGVTAEWFSVDPGELGDPADLMAQATEQLANLAVREHMANQIASARQEEMERRQLELQQKNEQLQKSALHDALTGVYNRKFFDETISNEVARCRREGLTIGVVFIDADHFKRLNDTYGHQFGDTVLKAIAETIRACLRTSDTLARYGGEEFVVLVHEPTETGIERLAERIRAAVASAQLTYRDAPVPISVSIGAALAVPEQDGPEIISRLIETADQCMYEAKQGGRNQVRTKTLLSEKERELLRQVNQQRFSRWLVAQGVVDIPTVSKALAKCHKRHLRVGEIAVRRGLLTSEQVDQIVETQKRERKGRFGEIAVSLGYIDEMQLVELLVSQREDAPVLASTLAELKLLPETRVRALLQEWQHANAGALTECAAGV